MFLPSDQAATAQHFWTLWRWFHFSLCHQSGFFFILNKPGARFIHLTLCLHSGWLCHTSVCCSVTNIQRSWASEFKPSSLPLPSWLSEYYRIRGTGNVFLNVCTTGAAFRVLTCSSSQGCGQGQSHNNASQAQRRSRWKSLWEWAHDTFRSQQPRCMELQTEDHKSRQVSPLQQQRHLSLVV